MLTQTRFKQELYKAFECLNADFTCAISLSGKIHLIVSFVDAEPSTTIFRLTFAFIVLIFSEIQSIIIKHNHCRISSCRK